MPGRQSNVSPTRPQPRSTSSMPARAYVAVSRSGETWSPQTSVSSPVLPMTVRSRGATCAARPLRRLAATVPPGSVTTRMSVAGGFAQGPERATAAPGVETRALPAREGRRQRALRHGDEAEAHPDPVQALRSREHRDDTGGGGVVEDGRDELRGDFQRLRLDDDDRPLQALREAEFAHTLGRNLEGLAGLWITADARLAIREDQLAEARQEEHAALLGFLRRQVERLVEDTLDLLPGEAGLLRKVRDRCRLRHRLRHG